LSPPECLPPDERGNQLRMDSDRFRRLLDAPGPFASVYFDDSHDTHDAEAQLSLKWRAVKEELEGLGAD